MVSTPVQLLAMLEIGNIGLDGCRFLVFDGFYKLEPEIQQIINNPKWKIPTKSVRITGNLKNFL